MADAEDLKSSDPKGRAGSSPALGTMIPTTYEQSHFCPLFANRFLCLFCVHFYDLAAGDLHCPSFGLVSSVRILFRCFD